MSLPNVPESTIYWYCVANLTLVLVTQEGVLKFARRIVENGYNISKLQVDHWQKHKGDMAFDSERFPNPDKMMKELTQLGIKVSLSTQPYFNLESNTAKQARFWAHFITHKQQGGKPITVSWCHGLSAYLLDSTSPQAVDWFVKRHRTFAEKFGVHSWRLMGGEINTLNLKPRVFPDPDPEHKVYQKLDIEKRLFKVNNAKYPNQIVEGYVRMMVRLGDDNVVEIGSRTSHLGIATRMNPKFSLWDMKTGMPSVLQGMLQLTVAGYTWVMPDIIGGHYFQQMDQIKKADKLTYVYTYHEHPPIEYVNQPERELYIRWMQMSVFMPYLQFAFPPYDFDQKTRKIIDQMLELRSSYNWYITKLAESAVKTGIPMIRPMWWYNDTNEAAWECNDQYFFGPDILVCPVLYRGVTRRSVYLPEGHWRSGITGKEYGGTSYTDHEVPLDQLLYFIKIGNVAPAQQANKNNIPSHQEGTRIHGSHWDL